MIDFQVTGLQFRSVLFEAGDFFFSINDCVCVFLSCGLVWWSSMWMVLKLFGVVLECLGLQLFEKVEVDKPAASRSESAEIYVLGLRYKAPAKVDPRLLDVKHLFQASAQPQAKVNCFR